MTRMNFIERFLIWKEIIYHMNELNIGSFVAGSTENSPDDARDEYYIQLGYDYYDTVKSRNGW